MIRFTNQVEKKKGSRPDSSSSSVAPLCSAFYLSSQFSCSNFQHSDQSARLQNTIAIFSEIKENICIFYVFIRMQNRFLI